MLPFYGREEEIARLHRQMEAVAGGQSRMVLLTGRRRVGKTRLLFEAFAASPYPFLYLFVPEGVSSEELCRTWESEIRRALGLEYVPGFRSPAEALDFLMAASAGRPMAIVLDECQELSRTDPSIWGTLQALWDRRRMSAQTLLIMSGSIISALEDIFGNRSKPLYGRLNEQILLFPFQAEELKAVLHDVLPDAAPRDLLTVFALTGGVPKYVELLEENKALTSEAALRYFFGSSGDWLRTEGDRFLSNEFRLESPIYRTLLLRIAAGRSKWQELQEGLPTNVTAYLQRLETFGVVRKILPFGERKARGILRYEVCDPYFDFWLTFAASSDARTALERGGREILRQIASDRLADYLGHVLEVWFRKRFTESGKWLEVGAWWDRKGENEIDLVALNPLSKRILFAEVKMNPKKYVPALLEAKAQRFFESQPTYRDWTAEFIGLSPESI